MSPPDQLNDYKEWHMQFAIEVYGHNGEVIEKRVFERDYPYLIFGRDPANVHVFCGHDSISGQHAVFFFAWDAARTQVMCYLHNLESTHGVRINDILMPASGCTLVRPEMDIQFGRAPVIFKFKYSEIVDDEDTAGAANVEPVPDDEPPVMAPPPPPPPPPPPRPSDHRRNLAHTPSAGGAQQSTHSPPHGPRSSYDDARYNDPEGGPRREPHEYDRRSPDRPEWRRDLGGDGRGNRL